MKPVFQQTPTGCIQACVATLLEYPLEQVPDFAAIPDIDSNATSPAWYLALQKFLFERGFVFVDVKLTRHTPWVVVPYEFLVMFFGPRQGTGSHHAIVGKCSPSGFLPVFDPYPLDDGYCSIENIDGIGMIVPVDPFCQVRMGYNLEKIEQIANGLHKLNPAFLEVRGLARDGLQKPVEAEIIIPNFRKVNGSSKDSN